MYCAIQTSPLVRMSGLILIAATAWMDRKNRVLFGDAVQPWKHDRQIPSAFRSHTTGFLRTEPRAMVVQRKTQQPVQFELTEPTRSAVSVWIEKANLKAEHYLSPSRLAKSPHVSPRQFVFAVIWLIENLKALDGVVILLLNLVWPYGSPG